MPFYKYTMVFTYFSGITDNNPTPIRIGGWTESYYKTTASDTDDALFRTLMNARLGICPRGTHISRYRIQQVLPEGPSKLRKIALSAPNTWLSGIPQKALKVPFAAFATRAQTLREFRGVPDVQFTTGEYTPTQPYLIAVGLWLTALASNGWSQLRRDEEQQYEVQSISAGGVVVMREATAGIALGSQIQVMRSIDPTTGRRIGYFARVTAFVDPSNFTISGPKVKATNFGKLRVAGQSLVPLINPDIPAIEAVARKIGRPFKAYSGRASKRP